jgi:hypothetical protein
MLESGWLSGAEGVTRRYDFVQQQQISSPRYGVYRYWHELHPETGNSDLGESLIWTYGTYYPL